MIDLDVLEAKARAATSVPMSMRPESDDSWTVFVGDGVMSRQIVAGYMSEADARFLVAARAAVPALVEQLRKAEALIAESSRRLRGLSPLADDGTGTLRARLDDFLKGREQPPTYDVLRSIVRDLAEVEPIGSIGYENTSCTVCLERGTDLRDINGTSHYAECPYRRAVEAQR